MARELTWLDVFTSVPLAGNGLCVVHDADDLDATTMLAIARETRLSETTFVQTATEPGADYRNRIFTLHGELPFAGHPSLGTAVAVARRRGATQASYVQQTQAGLQPVDVTLDGVQARASMLQNPAVHGAEPGVEAVLAAAGLAEDDAHPGWPPQVVSTGVAHVVAPVRDGAALERARAHPAGLPALLEELGATCVYLAAVDADAGTARARSFFLGDTGTLEDPATGSAVGPLLAYLHRRAGLERLTVAQGDQIGRPSTLDAAVEADRIRVSGDAVVVAEGRSL
jgi:trans-2,3-dihydro-3-hydroxyanthranilate isomerase